MSDETIAMSPADGGEEPADAVLAEPLEETGSGEPGTLDGGEPETVDAVPVLAEARPLAASASSLALPAVQAAAVAATGFVAGAATVALVRRHTARKLARARTPRGRALDMLPIVGSRTFLVDVHLLAKPDE
jgi:hypothetical protein